MRLNQGGNVEQLNEKARELQVVAAACGLDASAALDDIADSFEKPNKVAASLNFSQDRFSEDWAPVMDVWAKWWGTFLEEYSLKCVKRWIAKCGHLKDTQIMEKLWLQYFEPLWVAGCNIAKHVRLKDLKDGVTAVFSRHSENLSSTEREDLQADLQAWIDWCDKWGEAVLLVTAEFKEKHRRAIAHTLRELREYDEASLIGKLSRLISG